MSRSIAQFDRAFAALAEAVEAGRIPGGVLGVIDGDGQRTVRAVGAAQTVPHRRPMTEDTWFPGPLPRVGRPLFRRWTAVPDPVSQFPLAKKRKLPYNKFRYVNNLPSWCNG